MIAAKTYLTTLMVFLAIDAVWLMLIGGPLYTRALGDILAEQVRVIPAVLFYLLYVAGIVVLVLPLARPRARPLIAAALYGGMFGLCAYGTFDLTNHAVLKAWSWHLTVIDMAWGTFVTAVAATAGAAMERRLAARDSNIQPSSAIRAAL